VLARISNLLAEHHISFATVNQKELSDGTARIMLTTHRAEETAITAAKRALEAEEAVLARPVSFRFFESNT